MPLIIESDPAPLEMDEKGVIRVRGTRVSVDTVLHAFEEGATAEEIVQQYPSIGLANVYAVIGYYLRHRAEMQNYLTQRLAQRVELRQQDPLRADTRGIRERLEARRTNGP